MDKDLISTALGFSPHVLKTRRKKKKMPVAVSKLSLKHRSAPKPSSPFALSESNSSTRNTSSTAGSRNVRGKENLHPLSCQCNDCLITSDSSGSQDQTLRQVISAHQCASVSSSNPISEDDDYNLQVMESDAKTTVTHSTYVTCVSKQAKTEHTQDETEEEVDILQSSFKTLVLTPDNSNNNVEVSSCEKVKQWLIRMNVSSSSVNLDNGVVNHSHISESSSEDEYKQHSLAKTSSSGYPNTVASTRCSNILDDSLHATSRQSSSAMDYSQSNSSFFNSQRSTRNGPVQEPHSDVHTQESDRTGSLPDRNSGSNNNRDSMISTVTSSQANSASTRSSSLYFIDRPPWSKHSRKSSRVPRPSVANLSDIREQIETSNIVSNISTHDSTLSSDASSFHLVYSETISPQGNVSQTRLVSPEITPDKSEDSLAQDDKNNDEEEFISLREESSMSIISNSTRNSFLPRGIIPENPNKSTKTFAPPASVISSSTRFSFKPRIRSRQNESKESCDRAPLSDTIPFDEFFMSNVSTSTRYSRASRRITSQNLNVITESPDKVSLPDTIPYVETSDSNVSSTRNYRAQRKTRTQNTEIIGETCDNISLPDTIPYVETSDSNYSSIQNLRPQRKTTTQNTKVIKETSDKISLPDTIPYVETSDSNISSTINLRPQRKTTTQNTKYIRESGDQISLPDTIPYVETSDSNYSSIQNLRPQRKTTTQNTKVVKKASDKISLPDTIPYVETSDSYNISNSIQHVQAERKVTAQNTKESSKSCSIPDTIPLPNSATTDSLSSPDVRIDPYAAPVNVAAADTDVFSWPMYSKTELDNILLNIAKQNNEKEKSNSEHEVSSTSEEEEEDAQETQHKRTTLIQTSTECQVETYRNSQENSSEDSTGEVHVTASRNFSVIEISSSDEVENDNEEDNNKREDNSDSEAESPFRLFRRRPNRASYVEIVISESEISDVEQDKNNQDDNVSSSSDSDIIIRKNTNRPAIEISESDSSPEATHKTKRRTRTSAAKVQAALNVSDSQQTYFSQAESESQLQTQIRMSRVADLDLPEISEDESEEQDPAVRRLDFEEDESSDEEEILPRPSVKKTSRKKSSSEESNTSKRLSKPAKLSKSPFKSPPIPQPSRKFNVSSDSSENDERLEQFFESERKKREQKQKINESLDDSPNFIVSDNDDSDDGLEDMNNKTPSFYLRVLNEELRRGADKKYQPPTPTFGPRQNFPTPTPTKGRTAPKTAGRVNTKPRFLGDSMGGTTFSPVLSFLASLSLSNHTRCHPEAVPYVKRFKSSKEHLTKRLFSMFNEKVFKDMLPSDMSITWNNRLRSTAGFCYNKKKPVPGGEYIRTSRIELSAKILHDAGRLRDTLIHEMCHAATWVISGQLGGHGPVWKEWTRKARRCFPELPEISRCHSYEVKTKYTYKCTQCGYSFGRHTNSLDIRVKVCGLCRGKFEVLVNGNPAGANATPRQPNVFALFVRENYRVVKNNRKSLKHGDVMKMLSKKFAEQKIAQK